MNDLSPSAPTTKPTFNFFSSGAGAAGTAAGTSSATGGAVGGALGVGGDVVLGAQGRALGVAGDGSKPRAEAADAAPRAVPAVQHVRVSPAGGWAVVRPCSGAARAVCGAVCGPRAEQHEWSALDNSHHLPGVLALWQRRQFGCSRMG